MPHSPRTPHSFRTTHPPLEWDTACRVAVCRARGGAKIEDAPHISSSVSSAAGEAEARASSV